MWKIVINIKGGDELEITVELADDFLELERLKDFFDLNEDGEAYKSSK